MFLYLVSGTEDTQCASDSPGDDQCLQQMVAHHTVNTLGTFSLTYYQHGLASSFIYL